MWYIILALFVLLYGKRILAECFRYHAIKHSIRLANGFCVAYPSNRYEKELERLLKYSSVIRKYVREPRVSRTLLPNANYANASRIRLKMMDALDEQRHNALSSLNPMNAVKDLVLFPVTILRWIGFKPGKIASTVIANVWWILQYLLDTFQPEIRELLIEFVRKLVAN